LVLYPAFVVVDRPANADGHFERKGPETGEPTMSQSDDYQADALSITVTFEAAVVRRLLASLVETSHAAELRPAPPMRPALQEAEIVDAEWLALRRWEDDGGPARD
jgi:hypothetical protein